MSLKVMIVELNAKNLQIMWDTFKDYACRFCKLWESFCSIMYNIFDALEQNSQIF